MLHSDDTLNYLRQFERQHDAASQQEVWEKLSESLGNLKKAVPSLDALITELQTITEKLWRHHTELQHRALILEPTFALEDLLRCITSRPTAVLGGETLHLRRGSGKSLEEKAEMCQHFLSAKLYQRLDALPHFMTRSELEDLVETVCTTEQETAELTLPSALAAGATERERINALKDLYCPVNFELISAEEAVYLDASFDGKTYNRQAIIAWLNIPGWENTSPHNRQPFKAVAPDLFFQLTMLELEWRNAVLTPTQTWEKLQALLTQIKKSDTQWLTNMAELEKLTAQRWPQCDTVSKKSFMLGRVFALMASFRDFIPGAKMQPRPFNKLPNFNDCVPYQQLVNWAIVEEATNDTGPLINKNVRPVQALVEKIITGCYCLLAKANLVEAVKEGQIQRALSVIEQELAGSLRDEQQMVLTLKDKAGKTLLTYALRDNLVAAKLLLEQGAYEFGQINSEERNALIAILNTPYQGKPLRDYSPVGDLLLEEFSDDEMKNRIVALSSQSTRLQLLATLAAAKNKKKFAVFADYQPGGCPDLFLLNKMMEAIGGYMRIDGGFQDDAIIDSIGDYYPLFKLFRTPDTPSLLREMLNTYKEMFHGEIDFFLRELFDRKLYAPIVYDLLTHPTPVDLFRYQRTSGNTPLLYAIKKDKWQREHQCLLEQSIYRFLSWVERYGPPFTASELQAILSQPDTGMMNAVEIALANIKCGGKTTLNQLLEHGAHPFWGARGFYFTDCVSLYDGTEERDRNVAHNEGIRDYVGYLEEPAFKHFMKSYQWAQAEILKQEGGHVFKEGLEQFGKKLQADFHKADKIANPEKKLAAKRELAVKAIQSLDMPMCVLNKDSTQATKTNAIENFRQQMTQAGLIHPAVKIMINMAFAALLSGVIAGIVAASITSGGALLVPSLWLATVLLPHVMLAMSAGVAGGALVMTSGIVAFNYHQHKRYQPKLPATQRACAALEDSVPSLPKRAMKLLFVRR